MAKHNCPDCGAAHEMDTAGRIERLEKRVKELEAQRPYYYPYYPVTITQPAYPWTWTSTGTPNTLPTTGPVKVFGNTSGFLLEAD